MLMSKTFTLTALSATLVAMSAMANAPQQLQPQNIFSPSKITDVKPLNNLFAGKDAHAMKGFRAAEEEEPTPEPTTPVIYEADGTVQNITINGSGYYLFWGMMLTTYENLDVATHMVYGENNEVYLFNAVPNALTDTYIKGVKDGDKVTFTFPQTVLWDEEMLNGYDVQMLKYVEEYEVDENGNTVLDENGNPVLASATYEETGEPTTLTFTMAEDGSMTTTELSADYMLGYTLCSGGWAGYGAIDLSVTPFNEVPVAVPDDFTVVEDYWSIIDGNAGWTVNWAQGSEEVYFQGICDAMPEAWTKGTVEMNDSDATIKIAQDQYIGVYSGLYIYTKCAKDDVDAEGNPTLTLMPEDYQYELVWDFKENTIKAKDPNVYFVINAAKDRVYYLSLMQNICMLHQDSFAGTPANPTNLIFEYTVDTYGYDTFRFEVPMISTDGELLDPAYLSYVVYVDDEIFTFDAEEYEIPETLEEIPWDLSAYYIYNFGGAVREVDFFIEGITTVGVQSIYNYEGEETRSEIVTINLDTNSVKGIDSDKEVANVVYFDLAGRRIANPANGLYIKRTTYTDGTTVSAKKFVR